MKELFKLSPIASSILIIIVLGLSLIVIDASFTNQEVFYGTVVDNQYKAASTSIGVGTGIASNGKVGTVTTTSSSSEEFLLMVKKDDGSIETVKCKPELYYAKEKGQDIKCCYHNGLIFGGVWSITGLE